jgi:hypothetical protein
MRSFRVLPVALLLLLPSFAVAAVGEIQLFHDEQQAQLHCPTDTVVWSICLVASSLPRSALVRSDAERCVRM